MFGVCRVRSSLAAGRVRVSGVSRAPDGGWPRSQMATLRELTVDSFLSLYTFTKSLQHNVCFMEFHDYSLVLWLHQQKPWGGIRA